MSQNEVLINVKSSIGQEQVLINVKSSVGKEKVFMNVMLSIFLKCKTEVLINVKSWIYHHECLALVCVISCACHVASRIFAANS